MLILETEVNVAPSRFAVTEISTSVVVEIGTHKAADAPDSRLRISISETVTVPPSRA
jgi:hypothetical protein